MKALFNNIMVVIDGTDEAVRAAKYAIMLAKVYKLKLIAIYVVDVASIKELLMSKYLIPDEAKEYEQSLEESGNNYLMHIKKLADSKKVDIEIVLEKGSIYSKVIETAIEKGVDLIVIGGVVGSHHKGNVLSREYKFIINEARCSVLFVRDEDIERKFKKL